MATRASFDVNLTERDIARFWSKVRKAGPDECWPWIGSIYDGKGAMQVSSIRRVVGCCRIAWHLAGGTVAKRRQVRPRCRTRNCCNPAHLGIACPPLLTPAQVVAAIDWAKLDQWVRARCRRLQGHGWFRLVEANDLAQTGLTCIFQRLLTFTARDQRWCKDNNLDLEGFARVGFRRMLRAQMRHESEFGRRHFRLVMEGKTANPWVHRLSEFSDSVDRFGFLAQSDSDQQAPWDRIEQILTNAIEDSQAREVVFLRLVLGWSQHDTARFVKMNQRRVKRIIAEQTKILRERLRPLGYVARRRPAG